jgi:hypothetical protein
VLNTMGATVVADDLPIPIAHEAFAPYGRLVADEQADALRALVAQLHSSSELAAAA